MFDLVKSKIFWNLSAMEFVLNRTAFETRGGHGNEGSTPILG